MTHRGPAGRPCSPAPAPRVQLGRGAFSALALFTGTAEKIKTEGKIAVIEGTDRLSGVHCKATDLRGGAALVIAALRADGESRIGEIHHIERGYDDIVGNLNALGADIKYSGD